MFWWFSKNKEVNRIEEETKKGFEFVKKDIRGISGWIKYLDSEKKIIQNEVNDLKEFLSSIQEDVENIKNMISIMNQLKTRGVFKTPKRVFNKQTGVYAVETGVETGVETPNLEQFSITERAIMWILLNSDLKLSYDDLAAMLGKERSTMRGQINRIKQKSVGLIEEITEINGKKRVFINEKTKEMLLKKSKVRVDKGKKYQKTEKIS